MMFDPASVEAERIKEEDADYENVRVRFIGQLARSRVTMQIDVGKLKASTLEADREMPADFFSDIKDRGGLSPDRQTQQAIRVIGYVRGMGHKLYELDVRLREIEPPIWRTVEVPGAWSLEDVHFAIQVAMGWMNSHLHQFKIGDKHYGMADVDDTGDLEFEDEREYRLQDLVDSGGSFVYEYDFGDGWEHEVTVKKVTTVPKPARGRCVAGARACPPEDCGGSSGYDNLLEALANPSHEEHESSMTWSNGFNAEHFALPKHGMDLREEMDHLKAFADDDEPFEESSAESGGGPMMDLPKQLVRTVLALAPMQRASLGALIAGSLASELVEVRHVAGELVTAMQKRDKKKAKAPKHRKTARS